jgi:hypothetical protein
LRRKIRKKKKKKNSKENLQTHLLCQKDNRKAHFLVLLGILDLMSD